MNGIINVLKPSGMTSHDVVSFIRRNLKIKKVGHTGTLDPNAAGVLPICIGKATRVSQYLMEKTKGYRCELTLGKKTDTQDKYGNIIDERDVNLKTDTILNVIEKYKGDITQIPPMYSAIKHKGKRLYELAREGKVVERKPRNVHIYSLDVIYFDDNKVMFDVECSRGTYVRTLCNDIGEDLGTFGYMSFLIRTKVGKFNLENAFTLEEIVNYCSDDDIEKMLIPTDNALDHFFRIDLNENFYGLIKNGGSVSVDNFEGKTGEYLRVYCKNEFIGIGKVVNRDEGKVVKMDKVLI